MHSLFLKVFLWFWLAMILVIGALAVSSYVTSGAHGLHPPLFVEGILTAYARLAATRYESEGRAALDAYMQRLERDANLHARLFDSNGNELSGGVVTPDEMALATLVAGTNKASTRMLGENLVLEARPETARDGSIYVFVATLSRMRPEPANRPTPRQRPGPPGPFNFIFGESTSAFVVRFVAVILTAGLLCYWLARYIVSPVVKLREVTRQVAGGDLSARVSPALGNRRDELAAMGRDFDAMAARIETLVGAQNRLLQDISHELRSPLARLNVALDLTRKRAGAESNVNVHLDRIERESRRLNEMIGQLLALSRWEAGADGMRRQPVELCALVREVVEDAEFEARGHERAVKLNECETCETSGTHALLRSAVENVVRNAIRHAPDGTAVEVALRRGQEGEVNYAVLRVRDAGAGVPEDALSEIFRPFYRADDSRTRETGGVGLGLAITERAVRLHGGSVTAANVTGGGFVVEIRLPLATGSASSVESFGETMLDQSELRTNV